MDPVYETLRYGTSLALMNRSSFSSTSESPTRSLVGGASGWAWLWACPILTTPLVPRVTRAASAAQKMALETAVSGAGRGGVGTQI